MPTQQPMRANMPFDRLQNSIADAFDNMLKNGAELFEDAAASVARRRDEDGKDTEIALAADRRLRQIADYLRGQDGNALVASAIGKARSYPAIFVTGAAAVAAAAAMALISGTRPRQDPPISRRRAKGAEVDTV